MEELDINSFQDGQIYTVNMSGRLLKQLMNLAKFNIGEHIKARSYCGTVVITERKTL